MLRTKIEEIKKGDRFYALGEIRIADENAYQQQNEKESQWIVYDIEGIWYFEEDINSDTPQNNKGADAKANTTNDNRIQCAACGHLEDPTAWYNSAVHKNFRICPKCGTVRFVCDENREFRK